MDAFDQIHVVSDLHLGGDRGAEICNQGPALAALIDRLAAEPGRVALVINGDFVDFLAHDCPKGCYLDARRAAEKLGFVMDGFAAVFDALGRFVGTRDKQLTITLGNHDVEMALPEVQAALAARLGRAPTVITDRDGWDATVAGHKVHCEHGNDVDAWNVVPRPDLAALLGEIGRGGEGRWTPNAGTRLVVDVMNGVKADYPWVDLLKPETVIVPGILLSLPERPAVELAAFARLLPREMFDGARLGTGFLGDAGAFESDEAALAALLLAGGHGRGTAAAGEDLLAQATQDFTASRRAVDLADEGFLGLFAAARFLYSMAREPTAEQLRAALARFLREDRTFDHHAEDDTFRAVDERAPEDATFVIAGHTHLRRMLPRKRVDGVYFNTGTWIRLIELGDAQLATAEGFAPVYEVLTRKRTPAEGLAALDAMKIVRNDNTVVSIVHDRAARAVKSELRSVQSDGRFTRVDRYAPYPER